MELATWIEADAAVAIQATRMLPGLSSVVPVEAELRQLPADLDGGLSLKLNPHPPAHDLGQFKAARGAAPQHTQQGAGVERPVHAPLREADAGQPGSCRAQLFGSAQEPLGIRFRFHGLFLCAAVRLRSVALQPTRPWSRACPWE